MIFALVIRSKFRLLEPAQYTQYLSAAVTDPFQAYTTFTTPTVR